MKKGLDGAVPVFQRAKQAWESKVKGLHGGHNRAVWMGVGCARPGSRKAPWAHMQGAVFTPLACCT